MGGKKRRKTLGKRALTGKRRSNSRLTDISLSVIILRGEMRYRNGEGRSPDEEKYGLPEGEMRVKCVGE